MKIGRFLDDGHPRVFVDRGSGPEAAGAQWFAPEPTGQFVDVGASTLLCPVERPSKIVAVGLNYRGHAEEAGLPIPELPLLFAKFPSSLIGPEDKIRLPGESTDVDYEAELGVIIGSEARNVAPDDAMAYVLGFTCVNDVSARAIQFSDGQWVRGKSFDSFCPTGPLIVTPDEFDDPFDIPIRCLVNGEVVQDSSTAQMIFNVADLVSFISCNMTLYPGDLIATGTPPGVGMARSPQRFLTAGDTVTVEIDGIGQLQNAVEADDSPQSHWSTV